MANEHHLELLRQGVEVWNAWRKKTPSVVRPDISGADLGGANLGGANFDKANLRGVNLSKANLEAADLNGADLTEANLSEANCYRSVGFVKADLRRANLSKANCVGAFFIGAKLAGANLESAFLQGANFRRADLRAANLSGAQLGSATCTGANLRDANLSQAQLFFTDCGKANLRGAKLYCTIMIEVDLTDADLTGCEVYGVSAWGLTLSSGTKQNSLVITPPFGGPQLTVDNLEFAQFIYSLVHNEKVRDAIDTIGKKGVLLLGRFSQGRIAVLERLQDELRKRGFLPIVFNFEKPETKDFTETVRLLAGMSRFVIVDITNPRSAPLELQATVPEYMIPFVPILERGEEPFAMFRDLWSKHRAWVLEPIRYPSVDRLIEVLDAEIIAPAQERFAELLAQKAEQMRIRDI